MSAILIQPFLEGLFTGLGLIVAIGAQNIFVLKQGIKKNHVLTTALGFCLADIILIITGIAGFGEVFTRSVFLLSLAKWGGCAFMFWYGLRAFYSLSQTGKQLVHTSNTPGPSLKKTLLIIAALSFLNPHAYLDTVVLLGTIGTQFNRIERPFFAAGAITGSIIWFFSLSYGSRLLAPLLKNPAAWKVIDFLTGCIMWAIAAMLLFGKN